MLEHTLLDHKRNTCIRHQTGVSDIIDVIKKGVHGWTGHIARFKHNDNGQYDWEYIKQDGEKTLSATWVLRGQ